MSMKSGDQAPNEREPARTKILLSSIAAAVAESSTFPIDLAKTRLQLHGESVSASRSTTAFRVIADILRQQGPLGLYQGLSPAIIRHLFYTPIRIVGYEHLRKGVGDGSLSLYGKALVGGVSGVIAQVLTDGCEVSVNFIYMVKKTMLGDLNSSFLLQMLVLLQVVASPADLVKVRMQGDSFNLIRGLPPRYSGPLDAFNKIVHSEGIRGLWRGVLPNAQRAFLVNMGELACYDQAKHFVIQHEICNDNIFAHTLASMMSGLAATTLSCPADVVKTRMMNQAVGKDYKAVMYSSSYDCLVKTVRIEGLKALWKGFFPTWARLGPWQFVFWVSYEKFRKLAGLSSF